MALFRCECGCLESVCIRTNAKPDETLRKRRCLKCGNVYETTEMMVSQVKVLPEVVEPPSNDSGNNNSTKKPNRRARSTSEKQAEEKPESALDKAMKGIT